MKRQKKEPRQSPSRITADVVEARSIVLVDETGKERISLSCSNGHGGASFTVIHLNDDAGRPRITLQVDGNGNAGVILFTPNSGCAVSIAASDGGNGLSIGDIEGRPGISIGFPGPKSNDPRGSRPTIDVLDVVGQRTWSVFEGTTKHPNRSATQG